MAWILSYYFIFWPTFNLYKCNLSMGKTFKFNEILKFAFYFVLAYILLIGSSAVSERPSWPKRTRKGDRHLLGSNNGQWYY